jgi:hypothetical protein
MVCIMPTPLERQRWKTARKRAQVKRNITYYLVVNFVFLVMWLKLQGWPPAWDNFWPGWVLFGWGIALFFSFRDAYSEGQDDLTRREYVRLLDEEQRARSKTEV